MADRKEAVDLALTKLTEMVNDEELSVGYKLEAAREILKYDIQKQL